MQSASPELIFTGPSVITLRDYDPDTGWFQADLSAPHVFLDCANHASAVLNI